MLNIRVDVAGEEIFIVPFVPQHMPAQDALALAAELGSPCRRRSG